MTEKIMKQMLKDMRELTAFFHRFKKGDTCINPDHPKMNELLTNSFYAELNKINKRLINSTISSDRTNQNEMIEDVQKFVLKRRNVITEFHNTIVDMIRIEKIMQLGLYGAKLHKHHNTIFELSDYAKLINRIGEDEYGIYKG